MPIPRSCIPAVLTVRTGLHSGVSLALGRDTTIGQSAANQVCLLDDGVSAQHVRVTLLRFGLTVTPLAGKVTVNGALQTDPGVHRLRPGRSLELAFGPVVAVVERPARKKGGAGALAGLAALIAGAVLLPPTWQGATQSAALALRAPLAARPATATPLSLQHLSREVTERFAALGLDRTMKISVVGDGDRALSTTVSGVVEPASLADFEAFLAWYDTQPGHPALFNMTSRQLPKDQELPRIASVLLQPVPGLITDTGRQVRVGEQLPGGWTLTSVDADSVVLTLDGQSRVITLGSKTEPAAP